MGIDEREIENFFYVNILKVKFCIYIIKPYLSTMKLFNSIVIILIAGGIFTKAKGLPMGDTLFAIGVVAVLIAIVANYINAAKKRGIF